MAILEVPLGSMAAAKNPLGALTTFDIASTAILLLLALAVALVRADGDAKPESDPSLSEVTPILVARIEPRRSLVFTILTIVAATYFADGAINVIRAVLLGTWTNPGPVSVVSYVLGLAAYGLLAIFLSWKDIQRESGSGLGVWGRRRVKLFAILAVSFTITHIVLVATTGHLTHRDPPVGIPERPLPPRFLYSPFLHLGISILRLLVLLPLLPALARPYRSFVPSAQRVTEEGGPAAHDAALNGNGAGEPSASISITRADGTSYQPSSGLLAPQPQYGTFSTNGQPSQATTRSPTPAASESAAPKQPPKVSPSAAKAGGEVNLDPSWREMGQRIKRLLPYLWPHGSFKLQSLAFFCLILLIIGRFVSFAQPTTLRKLVSMFDRVQEVPPASPWKLLFLYAFLRFLQGSGGLAALRDIAWAPVMQYSDRKMSQMAFDHLLNLSLAFHTRRKTGEVLRILDRGQAINHIFELILFNVLPAIIDIVVALVVFSLWFSWTLSVVVFVVMFTYVVSSVALTSWRTKIRRQMNEKDIITRGIHTDCLLNYETVKYFGGEQHEAERYRIAIQNYQRLEFKVMASLNLLNLVQNFITSFGLLVGSVLVTVEVVNGTKETSDFVFFITYLAQVYGPLNNLGYIYRSINQSLVDTERLFKLLDEPRDVNDKPDAPDLVITRGEIEFKNVTFTYDERTTALKNISFKVPAGSSVALVGESGSGKSTILRLLYRFYDLKEGDGAILIDGQDIRDVTQSSLRRAIGVVPQDSVLFNNTISYNIGYGKFGADQGELEYAAQAAQMHDRILSFPDGYDTRVGERGVRLSGGEKQRISIARTFLKNAPVLLLDEATSALDTATEKDIQKALQNLLTGRSSLSIAHRLSTIANSDTILVLKDGEIIESGSHKSLLAANGAFAAMWAEQISTENDVDGLRIDIPTEDSKAGYDIAPLTAGPKAAIDITETPAGREALFPTEPPPPNPLLAPGPVLASSDAGELKLETPDDVADAAAPTEEPFVTPDVPAAEASNATEPEEAAETTAPESEVKVEEAAPESPAAEETAPSVKTEAPSFAAVAAAGAPSDHAVPIAFPKSEEDEVEQETPKPAAPAPAPAPVAFPSSSDAPVAFPSDAASITQEPGTMTPKIPATPAAGDASSVHTTGTPGVTFSPAATPSAGRPETPEAGEKRKRTASQNLSRMARRLSLGGRRASMQAAEAARAVEATNSRSDSPTPITNLMNKLRGASSGGDGSKDDSSVKSGSFRGATPAGAETPAEAPEATEEGEIVPGSDAAGTKKSKKNKKKSGKK